MAEHEVRIEPSGMAGLLRTRINGIAGHFELGTEDLAQRLLARPPDRLLDLLEIAAGVFAADSAIKRGEEVRKDLGARWRRDIHVHAAVRDPAFWGREDVAAALSDAIDVMSEDRIRFSFERAVGAAEVQSYFPFSADADGAPVEDVVLFSGGLDSLAGAIETLEAGRGRVALVTHVSSQKRIPHQRGLAQRLVDIYGRQALPVEVRVRRKGGKRAIETTQRSRTLLFAVISALVHGMLGGERVSIFENGVVSQNLPISPQVVGTMATRTTHPLALEKARRLLELVSGAPAKLANPYAWLTKSDVLARLQRHGRADLVGDSVSCSHVFKRTVEQPNCGVCSQCLDRRFAVLARGLEAADPAAAYGVDPLIGDLARDMDRTLALDWTRHGLSMVDVTPSGMMTRFGSELLAIARGHPELGVDEVIERTTSMQRRHGEEVRKALARAYGMHAGALARGDFPPTSLLAMLPVGAAPAAASSRPMPTVSPAPDTEESSTPPPRFGAALEVRLMRDGGTPGVEVTRLGAASGAHFQVVEELHPEHREDLRRRRAAADYRYLPVGELARRIGASKSAIAVHVKRCRDDLAELFEAVFGAPPEDPLLIQNRRQKGYRLDPDARFVAEEGD